MRGSPTPGTSNPYEKESDGCMYILLIQGDNVNKTFTNPKQGFGQIVPYSLGTARRVEQGSIMKLSRDTPVSRCLR